MWYTSSFKIHMFIVLKDFHHFDVYLSSILSSYVSLCPPHAPVLLKVQAEGIKIFGMQMGIFPSSLVS